MQADAFSDTLTSLRTRAGFTNRHLANVANVPVSLIAGLQSGKRRVGEKNARRIGAALGLSGSELETFVFKAINTSKRKVLEEAQEYPAELLNLVARQLRIAGVLPAQVSRCEINGAGSPAVIVELTSGQLARFETQLIFS